jgi:hypothetical protein
MSGFAKNWVLKYLAKVYVNLQLQLYVNKVIFIFYECAIVFLITCFHFIIMGIVCKKIRFCFLMYSILE